MKSTLLLSCVILLSTAGCCKNKPQGPVTLAAHTKTCLAQSDLADGKADKVVVKCPACALSMDGDPHHSAQIGGYTVHSCSADCNQALVDDPNLVFSSLPCDAPKKEEAPEAAPVEKEAEAPKEQGNDESPKEPVAPAEAPAATP